MSYINERKEKQEDEIPTAIFVEIFVAVNALRPLN